MPVVRTSSQMSLSRPAPNVTWKKRHMSSMRVSIAGFRDWLWHVCVHASHILVLRILLCDGDSRHRSCSRSWVGLEASLLVQPPAARSRQSSYTNTRDRCRVDNSVEWLCAAAQRQALLYGGTLLTASTNLRLAPCLCAHIATARLPCRRPAPVSFFTSPVSLSVRG